MTKTLRFEAKKCEQCGVKVVGRISLEESGVVLDVINEGGVWINGPAVCFDCMAETGTMYLEDIYWQ